MLEMNGFIVKVTPSRAHKVVEIGLQRPSGPMMQYTLTVPESSVLAENIRRASLIANGERPEENVD